MKNIIKKMVLTSLLCVFFIFGCVLAACADNSNLENSNQNNGQGNNQGGSETQGNLIFTLKSDDTYSVGARSKKSLGDVIIPSSYKDKSVTEIGYAAFSGCSATSITIPKSITEFASRAFEMSSRPNDVFYEGDLAGWCSIKAAVGRNYTGTPIKSNLYINGELVTDIVIPETITQIGVDAASFSYCRSLKTVTIPNSVTEIGYNAFRGCVNLKTVTISSSVVSLYDYAFLDCYALETIIYTGTSAQWAEVSKGEKSIPSSVTVICNQD